MPFWQARVMASFGKVGRRWADVNDDADAGCALSCALTWQRRRNAELQQGKLETEFASIFVRGVARIRVDLRGCVSDVVRALEAELGAPMESQRFLFGGRQLEAGRSLLSYGVCRDSNLHMVSRLRGGGGARKPTEEEKVRWGAPSAEDLRTACSESREKRFMAEGGGWSLCRVCSHRCMRPRYGDGDAHFGTDGHKNAVKWAENQMECAASSSALSWSPSSSSLSSSSGARGAVACGHGLVAGMKPRGVRLSVPPGCDECRDGLPNGTFLVDSFS